MYLQAFMKWGGLGGGRGGHDRKKEGGRQKENSAGVYMRTLEETLEEEGGKGKGEGRGKGEGS